MEADFSRFYQRDLATLIWVEEWPGSKLWTHVCGLPEDSAFVRALMQGHTSIHELLAQIRDAVVTTAHGWRLDGKPKAYERPQRRDDAEPESVDLTNPENAAAIARFFGTPH